MPGVFALKGQDSGGTSAIKRVSGPFNRDDAIINTHLIFTF